MTKFTIIVVFLCFMFGIFENAYSEQPKADEVVTAAAEQEKGGSPNERAGYGVRPMSVNPLANNPYNLVECYACSNCPRILPGASYKLCPYTPDTLKQGRCVVYAERYKQMRDPIYIRGCASDRGTCSEIKRTYEASGRYVDLVSCQECQGDRCNGAPKSMVDLAVAFITVALLPVIGKCTLS